MSERAIPATTQRAWLAVRLFSEGAPVEEIARRLPRFHTGGRSVLEGAVGVSQHIAFNAVQAGARALLAHVMRDEPPPEPQRGLWPPDEVRRGIRAIQRDRLRLAALRRWLRDLPLADGGGEA